MHFCQDEAAAVAASIPFVPYIFGRIKCWCLKLGRGLSRNRASRG